eukprot:TRINITY_DN12421_c0_g1_i1.p1 TRINITY_DN12421_c0_g1~~TRINITY_DN12421_c0_g1_i1.p1  ORF type:complete len:147 (-),score=17.64 TRINITY_DN12421_c0_g1_i1:34-447(-)
MSTPPVAAPSPGRISDNEPGLLTGLVIGIAAVAFLVILLLVLYLLLRKRGKSRSEEITYEAKTESTRGNERTARVVDESPLKHPKEWVIGSENTNSDNHRHEHRRGDKSMEPLDTSEDVYSTELGSRSPTTSSEERS